MENLLKLVEENDKLITISMAREHFGGCVPGWKDFCEQNDLEWKEVIRNGLLASKLLSYNDAMATDLVKYAYTEELNNG